MRNFKKISLNQFIKEMGNEKIDLYDEIRLPIRKTKHSAGYDMFLIDDLVLNAGESKKIYFGVCAAMEQDEFLMLVMRHSLGYKYNLRLCNQVGIIDHDYYDNLDNGGAISAKIQNEGTDKLYLKKGESVLQGIFIKYQIIDNEEKIELDRREAGVTTLV